MRGARPVEVPKWFSKLQNQVIERGKEDLLYYLGEPINEIGDPMSVFVDFGDLSNATYYEAGISKIIVDQARLLLNDTGYNHIDIRTNYVKEVTGEKIWFNKTIYLLINEPEVFYDQPPKKNDPPIEPLIPRPFVPLDQL